jgi:hypothetical protein
MYRWQFQTADRVLQEWATQQRLTVLEKSPGDDWYTGPGNRSASNKQVVYRIRVQDDQGRVQSGHRHDRQQDDGRTLSSEYRGEARPLRLRFTDALATALVDVSATGMASSWATSLSALLRAG